MKHLDLFSGIGGFALACEWAGIETIGFVEIDPFCQKVLKKHWPSVEIVEDVNNVEEIKNLIAKSELCGCLHGQVEKQSAEQGQQAQPDSESGCEPSILSADTRCLGQVPQSGRGLRDGSLDTELGRLLQDNPPSDVEDTQEKELQIQRQSSLWGSEPLLQGNTGIRQSTEPARTSDNRRKDSSSNDMRGMREVRDIQKRKDDDTSTSSGLQQTTGSDVALPEVSSSMAQEIHSKGGDNNGILLTAGFP